MNFFIMIIPQALNSFQLFQFIYSHDCKKNFGYCRVVKGGRFTIPKEVREKMSIKDGDFVDFLVTIYGSIKIIKFNLIGKGNETN